MILVDTGPLVALFDPRDRSHRRCRSIFAGLDDDLLSTLPVLTEASHLLGPATAGFRRVRDLVTSGGLTLDLLSSGSVGRAFELMEQYADQEMDFADASLVAVAEARGMSTVWTLDERDFSVYRIRRGRRLERFEIVS
jgi:hypothetical protein